MKNTQHAAAVAHLDAVTNANSTTIVAQQRKCAELEAALKSVSQECADSAVQSDAVLVRLDAIVEQFAADVASTRETFTQRAAKLRQLAQVASDRAGEAGAAGAQIAHVSASLLALGRPGDPTTDALVAAAEPVAPPEPVAVEVPA